MRVLLKYQIFEQPVILTNKDADRLSYHLGNWTRLNEVMRKSSSTVKTPSLMESRIVRRSRESVAEAAPGGPLRAKYFMADPPPLQYAVLGHLGRQTPPNYDLRHSTSLAACRAPRPSLSGGSSE